MTINEWVHVENPSKPIDGGAYIFDIVSTHRSHPASGEIQSIQIRTTKTLNKDDGREKQVREAHLDWCKEII